MAGGDKIVFQPLNAPLIPAHRDALDRLLESSDNQSSRLTWLLQPPGKINGKNVLQHLDRLSSIESLALPEGIDRTIRQNRLLKLAREGRKMSCRDLTRFSENILPWPEFVASLEETRHLARKNNFDPLHIITEKYSTLRKYAPRMLSALQLVATPAAQPLADALVVIKDMYRKQSRKVPPTAPLEFVPESWRKVVITPAGIDRQY